MMGQSRTVDAETFRRWMEPTVEVITTFAATVDFVASRGPAENSRAMRELHAEDEYR
jgi:hypothetical protein